MSKLVFWCMVLGYTHHVLGFRVLATIKLLPILSRFSPCLHLISNSVRFSHLIPLTSSAVSPFTGSLSPTTLSLLLLFFIPHLSPLFAPPLSAIAQGREILLAFTRGESTRHIINYTQKPCAMLNQPRLQNTHTHTHQPTLTR